MKQYDVIIVGGGAAGLNAALVLGRARRGTLLCDDGKPRNAVAELMHGYLSRDGTPPAKFLEISRAELVSYPSVQLVRATVSRAEKFRDGFSVTFESGEIRTGRRLLLANGVRDILPAIENLAHFWGRSVFVCPFCDGWEFRDRKIVVYGSGREAVDLAQEIYGWSKDVTICAPSGLANVSSKQSRWLAATGCELIEGTAVRLIGDNGAALSALELHNHLCVRCDALFLTAPLRQSCPIAEALGCKVDRAKFIAVDDQCQTNIRGCYAAGDAVSKVHQAILAASSGARAAIAICVELLSEEADTVARSHNVH